MAVKPVVIVGCARSGTSMIAGILHLHGVWVGLCRPADIRNPKGYFENRRIDKLVREAVNMTPRLFSNAIRRILKKERYPGGPWMVKHGVISYWHIWNRFKPYWLLVRRQPEKIMQSQKHNCKQIEDIYRRFAIMDEVKNNKNGFDIHPSKIIDSDYSELKQFMDIVGLTFSSTIVEKFVSKELWHQQ